MNIDLKKIISEDAASDQAQDSALKGMQKEKKRNKVLFGSAIAVSVAVAVTLAVYDPFTASLRWGDGQTQVEIPPPPDGEYNAPEWWQEPANKLPVALSDWQQDTYDEENREAISFKVQQHYLGSEMESGAKTLPSEATGYTSDMSKATLPSGAPNPMFSFWTKERFVSEVGIITEKLVNPVFGGWRSESRIDDISSAQEKMRSILSAKFIQSKKQLPLVSDGFAVPGIDASSFISNGNASGWVGKVEPGSKFTFTYDKNASQYKVRAEIPVKYTIWLESRSKAEFTAILKLTLVANNNVVNNSSNRVLVDDASIAIE